MKRGRPKNIIAGDASRVLASLAFGRRTVDELLEGRPQRHRLIQRLDANAHLVAVLDAVVHIEAMHRRPNKASEYRAALSCFAIHRSRLRDPWARL